MEKNRELRILLVEDEPQERLAISKCINETTGIKLIGETNSTKKALTEVYDGQPDAIILDIEMHKGEGDGISFMEKLNSSDVLRPFILVTTNNTSKIIHEKMRDLGADFIMTKTQENYNAEYVIDFLMSMKNFIFNKQLRQGIPDEMITAEDSADIKKRILKRIDTELDQIGINPKVLGRIYLSEAIQMIMVRPEPNFCKVIAKRHGRSAPSVDHAMANAIKKTWASTPLEELEKHYTAKINVNKGYPTYTEFIYYYAQKIKKI